MPSSELHSPSQAGELSTTKGRTQGLERREGSPPAQERVFVNGSASGTLAQGSIYTSCRWYASRPCQWHEVILSCTNAAGTAFDVQVRKNDLAMRTVSFTANANLVRAPLGFAIGRNDYITFWMQAESVVNFQVQLLGTSDVADGGTVLFNAVQGG